MRLIARKTLTQFVDSLAGQKRQQAVQSALGAWQVEVQRAVWRTSADVKRAYATASILDAERIVFNIAGNHYRMVVSVDYQRQIVFIKWLGSHAEYDKIDARTVRYGD